MNLLKDDCYHTVNMHCFCIEFHFDKQRHGFHASQLIGYTLDSNPAAADDEKNLPPEKLAFAFSTADVVVLGWRLGRLAIGGVALCLLLTDQAVQREEDPVRKLGAYFHAMINRAGTGRLHLHNSVFGVLKREEVKRVRSWLTGRDHLSISLAYQWSPLPKLSMICSKKRKSQETIPMNAHPVAFSTKANIRSEMIIPPTNPITAPIATSGWR